jgi:hypothetical protein
MTDIIEMHLFFPKTDCLKEKSLVTIDFDGKIESFRDAMEKVKRSVEILAQGTQKDTLKFLKYIEKNFDYYIISEFKSIVMSRHGRYLLTLNNTSQELNTSSRSIQVDLNSTVMEALNEYNKVIPRIIPRIIPRAFTDPANYGYYLGALVAGLIFYRYRYV